VNAERSALKLTLLDGRHLFEQKPAAWQEINGRQVSVSVRTDAAGNIYIAGYTASTDLPGPGSHPAQGIDAFVTGFNPSGNQVLYTTWLGGNGLDEALALAVSPNRRPGSPVIQPRMIFQ
jgi:hypothetical protein